jgi:8-oxo-dGTP pyrophosphatase MutT (NUDIX family)
MAEKVVTAVAYNPEKEKFLVLKRAESKKHFPGKWEFPAGFLESQDVKEEALRELKEETGFIGEAIRGGDSFEIESDTGNGIIEVHPVLTIVDYQEPELSREHTDYRWIDLNEIGELETVKGLEKDLENVGVKNE